MMDLFVMQYNARQNTPAYWRNKSHDLLVSARALWVAMQNNSNLEVNCWATYKMLMRMSFKLLSKAHCVGAGIVFDPVHDLMVLARTANFTASKEEKSIFEVLSAYILWDGRYPTPKKPEYLKMHWDNQNKMSDDNLDFERLLPMWRRFSGAFVEKYN